LAVELFQTENDDILINEVAPRPHNSGHYSIEAVAQSIRKHIRAILDLPLGNTDSKVAAIMVNLVGAEGHTGDVVYKNMEAILKMGGVTPHIYGKKQTRPFRKMGHVTIVNKDITIARKIDSKSKGNNKGNQANNINYEQNSRNNGKHQRPARNAKSNRHTERV